MQMTRRQHVTRTSLPRVGIRLRELLEERFLTHAELAQALGVDAQTVSRWVRGESGPTKRRLRQIAEYFGVEPASLIDRQAA